MSDTAINILNKSETYLLETALDSRSLGKFVMFLTLVGFLFDILRWIPRPFVKPTDGYFLISFWHLLLAAIGLFFWIAPHNSFIEKSIAWLSGRKFSSKK